jgi:hypothetical protein
MRETTRRLPIRANRGFAILLFGLTFGIPPAAHTEDLSKRAALPATTTRIRGAAWLLDSPSGLFAVGGARLRRLTPGARQWQTVLEVKGDHIYRVAEKNGEVLAAFENEPFFHLIDLRSDRRKTIPKPPQLTGVEGFQDWRLDWLDFAEDGHHAIVHMTAIAYTAKIGSYHEYAVYRISLDDPTSSVQLYRQQGFILDRSTRGTALIIPRTWANGCTYTGCPVAQIVAFEINGDRATRRLLFDSAGQRYGAAQIVPSNRKHGIAMQIAGWDETVKRPTRDLLRYTYGAPPLLHRLSVFTTATFDLTLLTANNDYVDAEQGSDKGLTMLRVSPAGRETRTTIPSWTDERSRPAKAWLTGIRERKNGDLWLTWGDNLVILDGRGPRRVDVGAILGRGTEWAGAYRYIAEPETVWFGIEMGGGRDYVRADFTELDRKARPWTPYVATAAQQEPMPPAETARPPGKRTERKLGIGFVSIGDTDLYYRENPKSMWQLLHAVPGRSIYRMQLDEAEGRIIAQWSSEREVRLFEPATEIHRIAPWPQSDVDGYNGGLQHLFFDPDGTGALVLMSGLVSGQNGRNLNEFYRIPFDGSAPTRLYRQYGHRLHVSERGATFIRPTKNQGHCNVRECVLDGIDVVELRNGRWATREVFASPSYTNHARLVPGSNPEQLGVVVQFSDPVNARNSVKLRELLRFAYGDLKIDRMPLPAWTLESVKRNHLTSSGDYIEFINLDEKKVLQMDINRREQGVQSWSLPRDARRDIDAGEDENVHGFGERNNGTFWLHWGDRIVLLSPGKPARAVDISKRLKLGQEWASADRYSATPETLTIGIDFAGGRTFVDIPLSTIERSAKKIGP